VYFSKHLEGLKEFICLVGIGRGRCRVSFERKPVSENVWGKSIDDSEWLRQWDSWTVTAIAKEVESVFRVSGTTILGKENVQRRVIEQTRWREGEWKVRRLFSVCFYIDLQWVRVGFSNESWRTKVVRLKMEHKWLLQWKMKHNPNFWIKATLNTDCHVMYNFPRHCQVELSHGCITT